MVGSHGIAEVVAIQKQLRRLLLLLLLVLSVLLLSTLLLSTTTLSLVIHLMAQLIQVQVGQV